MRYKIDLKGFMAECEANYFRLQRLFPAMANEDSRNLGISGIDAHFLRLRVCERTPYTALLSVTMAGQNLVRWAAWPVIGVRMYHDARLAEVVSFENARYIRPTYRYPNRRMYQRDEKSQWNHFLGEWLAFCQNRAYVLSGHTVPVNI